MNRLSRRQILGGAAMTAAAVALGSPSVQAQKRGPTLRFVAQADLKILDPVWTTGYITRNHGYLVYDTQGAASDSKVGWLSRRRQAFAPSPSGTPGR